MLSSAETNMNASDYLGVMFQREENSQMHKSYYRSPSGENEYLSCIFWESSH